MNYIIIKLVLIVILLLTILGLSIFIIVKVRGFLKEYFDTTSLKEAIEKSRIADSEMHKTVYSMENVYLDQIRRDFPNLNIDELKASAEANITNVLNAIETKNVDLLKNKNEKIFNYVVSKIEDLKGEKFVCDNIVFHKTVLSKYEKHNETATMQFQTSLEYFTREKGKIGRKKQTRYKSEFIHVIDAKLYGEHRIRVLGLNCPNCGAPIKDIDSKGCEYCSGSLIVPSSGVEFVKRIWFLNNMKEY